MTEPSTRQNEPGHKCWRVRTAHFLLLIALLTLGACTSIDSSLDVDFSAGERWQVIQEIRIDNGSSMLKDTIAQVESELRNYAAKAQSLGASVSWKRFSQTQYIQYIVQGSGVGLDVLSDVVFQGKAQIATLERDGRTYVYFQHYVVPDTSGGNVKIVIHGKRILEGNGRLADPHSMVWEDYTGWATALLQEHSVLSKATGKLVIDFYSGGNWQTELAVTVNQNATDPADIGRQLEEYLANRVNDAQKLGVQASWRPSSTLQPAYRLQMQGSGPDTLNESLLKGWASVELASDNVLPWGPRDIAFYETNPGELDFASLQVTLRGQQILSGNGRSDDKTEMTWIGSTEPIYASLTEKSVTTLDTVLSVARDQIATRGGWLLLAAFLLALLTMTTAIVALILRWGRLARPAAQRCPSCSFDLPAEADFCPRCGTPLAAAPSGADND